MCNIYITSLKRLNHNNVFNMIFWGKISNNFIFNNSVTGTGLILNYSKNVFNVYYLVNFYFLKNLAKMFNEKPF